MPVRVTETVSERVSVVDLVCVTDTVRVDTGVVGAGLGERE